MDQTLWRIIMVAPQRELRVAAEIEKGLGLLSMVPVERCRVRSRGRGNQVIITERPRALMPRYVFVGSRVGDVPWRDLMELRHVQTIVQFGIEPARLTDAEVDRIRVLARDVTVAGWKAGDRGLITDGPFRSIEALISAVRTETLQVVVPMFGSERIVEIRADQIEKVA
jgi:transcription antitermination factor NusG